MADIRQRVEIYFERLARLVYRNKVKALVLMAAITLVPASFLPRLTMDTTNESFFRKDDDSIIRYNAFKDQFGKDDFFVVAINAPDVFDSAFLAKLKDLHDDLKARVPYLDDINSLINARNTRGEGNTLIVEDLMKRWPENGQDLKALRERVLSNPLYRDLLVSEDGRYTTIILKAQTYVSAGAGDDALAGFDDGQGTEGKTANGSYLSNEQNSEMTRVIREVVKNHEGPGFRIFVAGSPVVVADIEQGISRTLSIMIPLSFLVIILFLFVMFRRISGVIYPLLAMVLSLLASFGMMAVAGLPITHITSILPTFLLVVGIGDSVHILAIFYMKFDEGAGKEDAIAYALGHSALAVLMTSLTTAAGLLSFVTADVAPIVDLGYIAPAGVMLALLYTIILIPALVALFPMKKTMPHGQGTPVMDRVLTGIAKTACMHPWKIVFISLAIASLSVVGMTGLRFSHNGLKWLPDDYPVRKATEVIDANLRGAVTLEVVIDTGRENGLHDPAVLNRLEESVRFVSDLRVGQLEVGKAWTITAILKEIHRALNENRPEFYALPQERKLAAQEFLLFENSGSDDLEDVVDASFRMARFTIKTTFDDAMAYKALMDNIRHHFEAAFPEARVTTTGVMALFASMLHNAITTMAKSYIIALSIITLLMIFLIGRVRIGLLSMVPNLMPIMMVLGIMGWFGIPLDLGTILVGSIAIGLVVDDTIHFMHNFRRYVEQTSDVEQAILKTMQTTGRAMLITSVVLAAGFFLNVAAEMKNTIYFGLLTGASVVFALIADYFLTPALMVVVFRAGKRQAAAIPRVS
ncbi:MAG: hypothetical protein A2010_02590 [Nitrospirae bacterium GWD2_57_9]|nr:MAG: hypothetical protein A2010_02590 [Nitrospirae bacterium GWD2_57_9]